MTRTMICPACQQPATVALRQVGGVDGPPASGQWVVDRYDCPDHDPEPPHLLTLLGLPEPTGTAS